LVAFSKARLGFSPWARVSTIPLSGKAAHLETVEELKPLRQYGITTSEAAPQTGEV